MISRTLLSFSSLFIFTTAMLLLFGASVGESPVAGNPPPPQEEVRYQATMVGTGGMVGARSIGITILIRQETSDEDLKRFMELVGEGTDRESRNPLRRELERVRGLGRITATGFVGTELAIVRERDVEGGQLITLMTARNLPFAENRRGGRSTDYPFSYVQLLVDEEGRGQGTVIMAARVSFSDDGDLEIESFGLQPFQLSNVRRR